MKQAQITLQTAKALYAQGGAARQLALDNFPKLALNEPNWPKSWEELDSIKGYHVDTYPDIKNPWKYNKLGIIGKNIAPTEADCESILAFCQLRQLAEHMNEGWEPSERKRGYTVGYQWPSSIGSGLHTTITSKFYKELIVFKTRDMAEFSLRHHKELWEKYWKV